VARAALREPDLPVARLDGPEREVRLLVDRVLPRRLARLERQLSNAESAARLWAEQVGPAPLWTRDQMQACLCGLDVVAPGIVDATAGVRAEPPRPAANVRVPTPRWRGYDQLGGVPDSGGLAGSLAADPDQALTSHLQRRL
jgi:hypothetical protein